MEIETKNGFSLEKEKRKLKKSRILIPVVIGIAALIMVIIAIVLLVSHRETEKEIEETSTAESASIYTTEEENAITKDILDNDTEITIEGYQWVEAEDGLNNVVVISVKNISDERTNFAFNVVALDNNDNVLDKTSLYAEGIEPGQVQIFHAFALSELTPEQLKQAHYKIYKAYTYTVETEAGTEE